MPAAKPSRLLPALSLDSSRLFSFVLFLCLVLTGGILLLTNSINSSPSGFPEDRQFRHLVLVSPGRFWFSLRDLHPRRNPDSAWLVTALKKLDTIERTGQGPERNNAMIARADLYCRFGYPGHGLLELNRAMDPPGESGGANSYWWLRAELESRLGDKAALATTAMMLIEKGYERAEIDSFMSRQHHGNPKRLSPLTAFLFWLFLLFGPALALMLVLPISKHPLPSSPPTGKRFSSLGTSLAVAGAVTFLVWLLQLPAYFFPLPVFVWAPLHALVAFFLTLVPIFWADRTERNTTWTFPAFVRFVFGWLLIVLSMPLTFILSWLALREMAINLPFWAVLHPAGPALGLPAFSGLLLLGLPLMIPFILGWRPLSQADPGAAVLADSPCRVHVWDIPGSHFANALTIGFISPTAGIGFTKPLLEGLSLDQIKAIAAHEVAHLKHRHLLLYFLFMFLAFLFVGFFAALNPMGIQRQLLSGPSLFFIVSLLLGWLLWTVLFASISRRCEREADRSAADQCGREAFLTAITRLYDLNLFSDVAGAISEKLKTHPGLKERKQYLREIDGVPFFPEPYDLEGLLVACWRSRLALEWKSGLSEAAHLVAIEYEITRTRHTDRISNLAACHARLGSECLVLSETSRLEVILCAQKLAVLSAEPNLPVKKVCLVCREGVKLAMNQPFNWEETPVGCAFQFTSQECSSNKLETITEINS